MENTKYGRQREGRSTQIRAKAQDTRANPSSWETHLVRKRWNIELLWALSLRIMMMMMPGIISPTTGSLIALHWDPGLCAAGMRGRCVTFLSVYLYNRTRYIYIYVYIYIYIVHYGYFT